MQELATAVPSESAVVLAVAAMAGRLAILAKQLADLCVLAAVPWQQQGSS
jgi:hypothetical protein